LDESFFLKKIIFEIGFLAPKIVTFRDVVLITGERTKSNTTIRM